jgi:hypothetical protein
LLTNIKLFCPPAYDSILALSLAELSPTFVAGNVVTVGQYPSAAVTMAAGRKDESITSDKTRSGNNLFTNSLLTLYSILVNL